MSNNCIADPSNVWCYDIEIYSNFWSVTFKQIGTSNTVVFYEVLFDEVIGEAYILNDDDSTEALQVSAEPVQSHCLIGSSHRPIGCTLSAWLSMRQVNLTLVGYNSLNYDDRMLSAICDLATEPRRFMLLKLISDSLIRNGKLYGKLLKNSLYADLVTLHCSDWVGSESIELDDRKLVFNTIMAMFEPPIKWLSYDLMEMHSLQVSLKHVGLMLDHETLETLPYDPSVTITPQDVQHLLRYNANDVYITEKLWLSSSKDVALRTSLVELFNVDVHTSRKAQITDRVIRTLYEKRMPISGSFTRNEICLSECVPSNIVTDNPLIINLINAIRRTSIRGLTNKRSLRNPEGNIVEYNKGDGWIAAKPGSPLSFELVLHGNGYCVALGGLHSMDGPLTLSCDNYYLLDADVTSYYPSMQEVYDLYPRHLDLQLIKGISVHLKQMRINAKQAMKQCEYGSAEYGKQNSIQESLKIVINTIFGKLLEATSFMYDPVVGYSVTIGGQLYLLTLIDELSKRGIQCVSANTDGVLLKVDDRSRPIVDACIAEWESRYGMTMEKEQYVKYCRSNVNNYLMVNQQGKLKAKGIYKYHSGYDKKLTPRIVLTAIEKWLLYGTPLRDTITKSTNIYDFLFEEQAKDGSTFTLVYSRGTGEYGKIVRLYYATDGGVLEKRRTDKTMLLLGGKRVRPLLQVCDTDTKCYAIDYNAYVAIANKMIDAADGACIKKGISRIGMNVTLDKNSLFYGL